MVEWVNIVESVEEHFRSATKLVSLKKRKKMLS